MKPFLLMFMFYFFSIPVTARANTYDDCILQNMSGAQNSNAVRAIQESCIRKVMKSVDKVKMPTMATWVILINVGSFNVGQLLPVRGMLIRVENSSPDPISGVSIFSEHRKTKAQIHHTVTDFSSTVQPVGFLTTGPGDPHRVHSIPPGQSRTFVVEAPETGDNLSAFLAAYEFYVDDIQIIPSF